MFAGTEQSFSVAVFMVFTRIFKALWLEVLITVPLQSIPSSLHVDQRLNHVELRCQDVKQPGGRILYTGRRRCNHQGPYLKFRVVLYRSEYCNNLHIFPTGDHGLRSCMPSCAGRINIVSQMRSFGIGWYYCTVLYAPSHLLKRRLARRATLQSESIWIHWT